MKLSIASIFENSVDDLRDGLKDYQMQEWELGSTLCIINTDANIGDFSKSDIIIQYDSNTRKPLIVTERLMRKEFTKQDWRKLRKITKKASKYKSHEHGFIFEPEFAYDYTDFTYHKIKSADLVQRFGTLNSKGYTQWDLIKGQSSQQLLP